MIKINKKILFLLFALSIFLLGILISQMINNGFKTGKALIFEIMEITTLVISSCIFFVKLYIKKEQKN